MRLIDADALKERIRRFLSIKSLDDLLPEEKAIVQHIDRMPTVDAVPVRHGRWERGGYDDYYYICSQCGYVRYEYYEIPRAKYCEHCGADMRKDGDDGKAD